MHSNGSAVHGGAFWDVVGTDLFKLTSVVKADVLDAWFPPAPAVLDVLQNYHVELCRTSPDTGCRMLLEALAKYRGLDPDTVLIGPGSSALIYQVLAPWAESCKRGYMLDPTYGEYPHLFENVLEKPVHRVRAGVGTGPRTAFADVEPGDCVALVNPNNPTGGYMADNSIRYQLKHIGEGSKAWIDETYIDFTTVGRSLETYAGKSPNTIVCKSMSKAYALSGLRVGYVVGHPDTLAPFRKRMPPWPVSTPALVAASVALCHPDYYAPLYWDTHKLAFQLCKDLKQVGLRQTSFAVINCIEAQLETYHPTAAQVVAKCREQGVYLRDTSSMGSVGDRRLRIAVRTPDENKRIVEVIKDVLIGAAPAQ